ncbi:MAG: amidohydrolase [Candidatus Asgardarchaeum californiense]|nr:MAG: amidohydrolase [Candidatus Asgardarchaeum californiense]
MMMRGVHMSDKRLIKGGIIVTMDKDRRIIENGYIIVEDGLITAIGKYDDVKNELSSIDETIDATKEIILPGLICSHTHLYGILLRGAPLKIKPPTDFVQNLLEIWWRVDSALTHDDAYASALAASYEMMLSGITFFADTYSGPNSITNVLDYIEKGVNEVGIRGMLAFETTERENKEQAKKGLEENIRFIKKTTKSDKIRGMYSIHASFTVSDEHIKDVIDAQRLVPAPITIHTSEGLVDLYHNLERYGKRTVERLNDVGLLGEHTILAHTVHINNDEIELIRKTNSKVAHNPLSNMLNAVGVPPVVTMLEKNITIGLGNDGFIFDAFENIRGAFLLHKVHWRDPRVISPLTVLEMSTINGAKLYGLDNEIGSLETGKKADIVILNPKPAVTPIFEKSVIGYIVYGMTINNIDKVMVDGEILVDNGQAIKIDENKIEETLLKHSTKLWERLDIKVE